MDYGPSGSPFCEISQARMLEWITILSSRGYSWPRDQTPVSCIGRQILYHWATWEALQEETTQNYDQMCKYFSF